MLLFLFYELRINIIFYLDRIDSDVNVMGDEYETYTNPDEFIIQQRGRRKMPVVFSPDIDIIKQVPINTY